MKKYFSKKLVIYLITFFVAVTINWVAPRLIPGNPIDTMLATYTGLSEGRALLQENLRQTFGLKGSLINQYLSFWKQILKGDLGQSITMYPRQVLDIVKSNIIYDIVVYIFSFRLNLFPSSQAYGWGIRPAFSLPFFLL